MRITVGKVIGIVIASGYVVAMTIDVGGITANVVKLAAVLLVPLALIWFPDELGSFTGYVGRGGRINTETPPILVSIAGWFLLVGLPALMFILS